MKWLRITGRALARTATALLKILLLYIAPTLLAIWLFDKTLPAIGGLREVMNATQEKIFLNSFELHPYDGWHIQSNFHQKGPMPPWPKGNFDIKSGALGFFVDFDLTHPPPQKPNEYRIVLIGGSGAQGFGATTNERMMYSIVQRQLNALFSPTTRRTYIVINMAMAGSITYQNYIALNRWGHKLQPDLIVSYGGTNDFTVPVFHELDDSFFQFNSLNALMLASRNSHVSASTSFLIKLFPNIMNYTKWGAALKATLNRKSALDLANSHSHYRQIRGIRSTTPKALLDEIALPTYIHALQSIKRDFPGVPIMVIWQAMADSELGKFQKQLSIDFYDVMYAKAKASLATYISDDWIFANFHDAAQNLSRECTPKNECIAVHSNDRGQEITAEYVLSQLGPFLRKNEGQGQGASTTQRTR